MRAFIVLCIVALASADQLGYNYHPVDQSYTPGGVSGVASFGAASNVGPAFAAVSSGPSFATEEIASNTGPSFVGLSSGPSFVAEGAASFAGHSFAGVSSGPAVATVDDASNAGLSFAGVNSGPAVAAVGDASNVGPSFAGVSSGPSFVAVGDASITGPSFAVVNSGPAFAAGASFDAADSGPSFATGPSVVASDAGLDFGVSQGGQEAASDAAPVAAGGFEKEFYTFTADEQDFNEPAASNQIASSLKQGIRVVFIKGPENLGLENAALSLARHASGQKTDIYVLSKQADLSDLANKLNTENKNINNRPEVHFVKYRTQEDATHAQHAIQAEYDALGGPSQHIDGGVASALNFASQAPVAAGSGPAGVAAVGNVGSTYLPASVLRLFRL